METNLEDLREAVISSFSTYQEVYGTKDWCEDGIRRAKEAKTIEELNNLEDTIETAWDRQC